MSFGVEARIAFARYFAALIVAFPMAGTARRQTLVIESAHAVLIVIPGVAAVTLVTVVGRLADAGRFAVQDMTGAMVAAAHALAWIDTIGVRACITTGILRPLAEVHLATTDNEQSN